MASTKKKKNPPPEPPRTRFLYRFYLSSPDGDYTQTLALVWAGSDDEAMDRGWDALPEDFRERLENDLAAEDEEEGLFVTCEDLADDPDIDFRIENALQDIPALAGLFREDAGMQADQALRGLVNTLVPLAEMG